MNTDRDNFEELLLKSNKITFIKALNIINERDYIGVDKEGPFKPEYYRY